MMKKSIVYLTIAAVVLTGLFMWGSNQGRVYATLGDNVTYTFPYLATHSDKATYCVVSNMTIDNATIGFSVVADSAGKTTTATQASNQVTVTSYVLSRQTRMISLEAQLISLDGTQIGNLSSATASNQIYGGALRFTQQAAASYDGDGSAAGKFGNATVPDWSCAQLPIACFQGTTSPKRNLVGYLCSDENMRRAMALTSRNVVTSGDALAAPLEKTAGAPYQKIYTY